MQIWTRVREFVGKLVYKDGATPLPLSVLVVVFSVTFFSQWISSMVISFLPQLVQWFGTQETVIGFNVGVIGTSMYIGAFISCAAWGHLSDNIGHRTCVVATSACCMVTTVAFGCSTSMNWAIVTRFLQGVSMGQAIPMKALLKDVCDDTNLALGMSVFLSAFPFGGIMPSLGGFTVFPSKLYPHTFSEDGLFGKFPALLPNLIVATGIGIGIMLTLALLPGDHVQKKEPGAFDGNEDGKRPLLQDFASSSDSKGIDVESSFLMLSDSETEELTDRKNRIDGKEASHISILIDQLKTSDFLRVLRTKECVICCIFFLVIAIIDKGFEQMFPILVSTDPKYKGMGLEPSQVGIILMITSIIQAFFQLTLLPKTSNYLGPRKLLITSNVLQAMFCPLIPAIALLKSKTTVWVGLVVVIFLVRMCVFAAYLALNITLNNSIDRDVIGSAIGITMAVKYAGKLLSPIACGGIYSWSLKNIKGVPGNDGALGFPFDQFLVYFFLSFLSVLCGLGSIMLPKEE